MRALYPKTLPYDHGLLDVGDGNAVYWETCGNPDGKPAVVLHGGPGSGCSERFRRFFDPDAYRLVLFDQRNCGRSTPNAADPGTDLAANTTANLVADIERLREQLEVDRWLVFGGSWGCLLALAYAEAFPARVTEMILFGVTTGRHAEWDWTFRGGLARFFPEQWERLLAALPSADRCGDVVEAFDQLLNDRDECVRRRAVQAWCEWESVTAAWPVKAGLAERFRDPRHAYAFARLVTRYARHYGWLEDGALLHGAGALADTRAVLVNGRFDLLAPIENAWTLRSAWPSAKLVIVEDAGHSLNAGIDDELVHATDGFAGRS